MGMGVGVGGNGVAVAVGVDTAVASSTTIIAVGVGGAMTGVWVGCKVGCSRSPASATGAKVGKTAESVCGRATACSDSGSQRTAYRSGIALNIAGVAIIKPAATSRARRTKSFLPIQMG